MLNKEIVIFSGIWIPVIALTNPCHQIQFLILWRKINYLVRENESSNSNAHGISASEYNYLNTTEKNVSSRLPK